MSPDCRRSTNRSLAGLAAACAVALALTSTALAVEPICPGGTNPDPNVVFCDDFEGGDYFSKWDAGDGGQAVTCGFGFSGCSWNSGPTSSDGSGCDGHYASTLAHWSERELFVRYYTYKTPGFPVCSIGTKGLVIDGPSNYSAVYACMWGTDAFLLHSYLLPSETLDQNQGNTLGFDGGRWYLIEAHHKSADAGQDNGVFELWIDDVTDGAPASQTLRMRYTNLPLGNSGNPLTHLDLYTYQNSCQQGWSDRFIFFDNIVVSRARIGSGGEVTPGCTESWQCVPWGACAGGQQSRSCADANGCGTTGGRPATTQPCGTPAEQEVASFTLINADTDQPMAGFDPLEDGAILDLAAIPTANLNLRANTVPATVGSVRFELDANATYRIENLAPYALGDDSAGDYFPWTPAAGSHTVTATPYSGSAATGTAGKSLSIQFTVRIGSGTCGSGACDGGGQTDGDSSRADGGTLSHDSGTASSTDAGSTPSHAGVAGDGGSPEAEAEAAMGIGCSAAPGRGCALAALLAMMLVCRRRRGSPRL